MNNHFPVFVNDATCVEYGYPDFWFPEDGATMKYKTKEAMQAKAICHTCSAFQECRDYSLKYSGLGGIWGGLDPVQRADMQKQLNIKTIALWETYPKNISYGNRATGDEGDDNGQ